MMITTQMIRTVAQIVRKSMQGIIAQERLLYVQICVETAYFLLLLNNVMTIIHSIMTGALQLVRKS